MRLKTNVFERYGADSMSRGSFFFVIGAILTWGFLVTYWVSTLTVAWQPGLLVFLLVGLGLPLLGIFMSRSESPLVSFIGYHLVVVPLGAILGPVLAAYTAMSPGIVAQAVGLTALVSGVMAVSGLLFPRFYRSIGGFLFAGLIALLVVLVVGFFVPAIANLGIIAWLAAGLFALLIGFDMYRASEIPATLDNAVDVSIALYLDIFNLFLWILRILGQGSD